jgi:hypothetical protein
MEPGVWGTDEPEPPDLEGEIYTRTLAELYADQGLYRRAADVLRRLVEDDPLDDELRSRLEEMEALTEAPEPTTTELASEVDGVAEAAEPTPDEDTTVQLAELGSGPSLDEQRLDEDLEVLAADLGTTPDAGPDVSTPFAWSESEVEVAAEDEGRPVADYFADLLAWEPREPLAEDVPVAADVTEAEGVSALEEPTQTVDLPATEEAEAVEIGSLAPGETVVPIESLAPDPAPTAPSEEEEQRVAEFKDWMRRLGK